MNDRNTVRRRSTPRRKLNTADIIAAIALAAIVIILAWLGARAV